MITPVLLCGGSGTRLWPASRAAFPKQFANLHGGGSLFQQAVKRLSGRLFAKPLVMTADDFRFIVLDQLHEEKVLSEEIVLEPASRNTAPAVLVASLIAHSKDPNSVVLVSPADHVIPDSTAFREAVSMAHLQALEGQIVTFGIFPTQPESGYGYLELDPSDTGPGGVLKGFVEKPHLTEAEKMVASGNYLWNAGIFMFRTDVMIDAFEKYAPDILSLVHKSLVSAETDLAFTRLSAGPWKKLPNISIDCAIMEKAHNLSVQRYNGEWSDLGSWSAVADQDFRNADLANNIISRNAHALDCQNSMLRSNSDGPQVVGIGLNDMIVVASKDAVLVSPKDQSQRVRDAVALLSNKGIREATDFSFDFRPWGYFEILAIGPRFQVKKLVVKPGGILSLQAHSFRAEHWIVVEGVGKVTVGDTVEEVSENESVYIPKGALHRLENAGEQSLVLIEVQTGSYFGEDDIVRYEDAYARI